AVGVLGVAGDQVDLVLAAGQRDLPGIGLAVLLHQDRRVVTLIGVHVAVAAQRVGAVPAVRQLAVRAERGAVVDQVAGRHRRVGGLIVDADRRAGLAEGRGVRGRGRR